jgi:hypothetical protein
MTLLGAISCGTLNAVERVSLSDVAKMGEAIVVLKADGSTRLYGVDEGNRLIPSERCVIGDLPGEAYKRIPGLEKVQPPSKRRLSKDDPKLCAGVAPNKAYVLDNFGTSIIKLTPNPHTCWFCYLDCSVGNFCNQVCIPTQCKKTRH